MAFPATATKASATQDAYSCITQKVKYVIGKLSQFAQKITDLFFRVIRSFFSDLAQKLETLCGRATKRENEVPPTPIPSATNCTELESVPDHRENGAPSMLVKETFPKIAISNTPELAELKKDFADRSKELPPPSELQALEEKYKVYQPILMKKNTLFIANYELLQPEGNGELFFEIDLGRGEVHLCQSQEYMYVTNRNRFYARAHFSLDKERGALSIQLAKDPVCRAKEKGPILDNYESLKFKLLIKKSIEESPNDDILSSMSRASDYNQILPHLGIPRPQEETWEQRQLKKEVLRAAQRGDLSFVEAYLQNRGEVDLADNEGNTLLMIAAREGLKALVVLLLSHGAEVNFVNDPYYTTNPGKTALIHALYSEKPEMEEIVRLLIEHGADIHYDKEKPLYLALWFKKFKLVDLLINKGVKTEDFLRSKGEKSTPHLQKLLDAYNARHT